MVGKTISHYQILEKLAEGGMGVVYKARDSRLKTLYFHREWSSPMIPMGLWELPVEGGEETKVLDSAGPRNWAPADQRLWFINWPNAGDAVLQYLDFASGKVTKVAPIHKRPAAGLAVSPDGRTILYVQTDQEASELMLVENFR